MIRTPTWTPGPLQGQYPRSCAHLLSNPADLILEQGDRFERYRTRTRDGRPPGSSPASARLPICPARFPALRIGTEPDPLGVQPTCTGTAELAAQVAAGKVWNDRGGGVGS